MSLTPTVHVNERVRVSLMYVRNCKKKFEAKTYIRLEKNATIGDSMYNLQSSRESTIQSKRTCLFSINTNHTILMNKGFKT